MFFQVDTDKCNKDQICVLECPARILQMTENGPVMVEGGEEICIRCGHCVAVCPVAAVSLEFLLPEDCLEYDRSLLPDAGQAEIFLRSRRSIRTYRNKPLPKEVVEKALGIASSAPTGSNRQLVKWLVLHERKDVEAVTGHVMDWMRYMLAKHPEVAVQFNMQKIVDDVERGMDRICRNAPHLVFAYADKAVGVGAADCHTALAYLELILPSLWAAAAGPGMSLLRRVSGHRSRSFSAWQKIIGYGAVMAGIPKFHYDRIPPRNLPDITYR